MTELAATTDPKHDHRWRKGQSGNPAGRPKGARNRATCVAEQLLDGEAEELMRRCIELAKQGDKVALRLCIERICPPRKERPVAFALPPLTTAADVPKAMAAIAAAVASGELSLTEAGEVTRLITGFATAIEVHDLEAWIRALEADRRPA